MPQSILGMIFLLLIFILLQPLIKLVINEVSLFQEFFCLTKANFHAAFGFNLLFHFLFNIKNKPGVDCVELSNENQNIVIPKSDFNLSKTCKTKKSDFHRSPSDPHDRHFT